MNQQLSETIEQLLCKNPDCNHIWFPRSTQKPKKCPRCQRPLESKKNSLVVRDIEKMFHVKR